MGLDWDLKAYCFWKERFKIIMDFIVSSAVCLGLCALESLEVLGPYGTLNRWGIGRYPSKEDTKLMNKGLAVLKKGFWISRVYFCLLLII